MCKHHSCESDNVRLDLSWIGERHHIGVQWIRVSHGTTIHPRQILGSMGRCPLMAQSGHRCVHCTCPLSGVKRTSVGGASMSANGPPDTRGSQSLLQPPISSFCSSCRP